MKLLWSPEAVDDLTHARQYIAQDDPAAANRIVQAIVTAVEERLQKRAPVLCYQMNCR